MSLKTKICLNSSDVQVKEWFKNVGPEETYRQYLKHGYFLPDWGAYKQNKNIFLRGESIKTFLNSIIPANSFKYENISKILGILPVEAQAAFWKNTFYFKDQVSIGEAAEEGFHAVISTILTPEQRVEFYEIGEKILGKNLDKTVSEYLQAYPKTYVSLTTQGRKERVIEEYFAQQFVNWFQYNQNNETTEEADRKRFKSVFGVFGDFIYELFDSIRGLFTSSAKNRNYIESLFANIKKGEYKNNNVISSDNTTPSTYNLIGDLPSGGKAAISASATTQIVNNLVGQYYEILQTTNLDDKQALDKAMEVGAAYYEIENPAIRNVFNPTILTLDEETYDEIEASNPQYVELKSAILERAYETSNKYFDSVEEELATDEDQSEYEFSDSTGANERGFSSISTWLKQYLKTVGIVKRIVTVRDELIPFREIVDERKLYYGVARALQNSKTDVERLIRLISFSENENNEAAKAFVDKLIKDGSGKTTNEEVALIVKGLQSNYVQTGTIDVNKYFHPDRTYIIQNVLKGFNLWSRSLDFQRVDPSKGTSETFNANVNNSVNTQVSEWQQNHLNKTLTNFENLSGLVSTINLVENKTVDQFETTLKKTAYDNQQILKDALGVTVSVDALKWLLITDKSPVYASTKASYESVKNEVYTFAPTKDIDTLLSSIKSEVKEDNFKELYEGEGIKKKLRLLAQINAVFDENVFESSYKNAEGKTIYGFQYKTFDLEFVRNIQKKEFLSSLMTNGITKYRTDKDGNNVWLNEPLDFLQNNIFLRELVNKDGTEKDSMISRMLPYFKLVSLDGLAQRSNGVQEDGVTFSNITTANFDLVRMNMVVSRSQEITDINAKGENIAVQLYPHYLGNLEAKRTADFVYLPEIPNVTNGNTISNRGIIYLKEEIRKEYDRIQRVHSELKTVLDAGLIEFNKNNQGTITTKSLKKALGRDVIEKYHTGKILRTQVVKTREDGSTYSDYIYKSLGVRALQFSDSVKGVMNKTFMSDGLTDAAIEGVSFNEFWKNNNLDESLRNHWKNEIFKTHLDRLTQQGNLPLLDNKWKIDGKLNEQKYYNFIVSSFINTLAFNQMMHGDPALLYKNDGADMPKRFGGRNAAIQNAETYLIAPNLGITEPRTTIKYAVGTEFVNKVAYEPFKVDKSGNLSKDKDGNLIPNTIDQADAQNYVTTEYKRYLLWSRGKLNKNVASILDKVDQGIPLSERENKTIFSDETGSLFLNVDKTVAFNGVQYLKKSDFMLTKEFTSRLKPEIAARIKSLESDSSNRKEIKDLRMDENNWVARPDTEFHHNLRQNMEGWRTEGDVLVKDESKRYDLYMPVSASKMLNVNVFDYDNSKWNEIDDSILEIEAKDYGLQLENPAGKTRIIDPSQMLEIIFNEQDEEIKVYYNGEERAMSTLEKEWQKYLTARDNSLYSIAKNQIYDENEKFDGSKFFEKAISTLVNSGADSQTISVYQLENGKPVYNPNMGITRDKFAALYFAHLTKGVLQQKVSGDALAHVSSYGIKPLKKVVKYYTKDNKEVYHWEVVQRDSNEYSNVTDWIKLDLESTTQGVVYDPTLETDELRAKLAEMYEQAAINGKSAYFTDELRHLKPKYNVDDNGVIQGIEAYFSESMIPHYSPDIKSIDNTNRWMFGTRIPSQDKHSAVNVEWVDTLPVYYGNSIITAKEIVTISGSDFDIDKLFVIKPEFYKYKGVLRYYGDGNSKYEEYIAFLKNHHTEFKGRYNQLVLAKSGDNLKSINDVIKEIETEIKETDTEIINSQNSNEIEDLRLVLDSLNSELQISLDKKESLTQEWIELNKSFKLDVANLLNELRLPASDEEIDAFENPYTINNELLKLRQTALTNDGTLLSQNEYKAIYKTSATMSALVDVKNDEMFIKENGTNVFDSTNELPFHTFATHSIVHSKVVTGKQNITPFVNGNLGLILAKRAGLKVNSAFQITINGFTIKGFNNISADNQRVFDTLSTLISAATDEAKEQLNAQYNITLEGAVLVKTMVAVGLPLNTAIAFVNQPVIQKFLQMKKDNFQSVFIERNYKSEEDIIMDLVGTLNKPFEGEYGNKELGQNLKNELPDYLQNQFDKRILTDMLVFDQIGKQMDKLARFVKLKKGFTDGFRQLDLLNDAIEELGVNLTNKKEIAMFKAMNPIDTHKLYRDEVASKIPQTINYMKNIVPDQLRVTKGVFFERIDSYSDFRDVLKLQLRNLNADKDATFNKELDSFMFVDLYLDKIKDDTEMLSLLNDDLFISKKGKVTVAQTFLKLKSKIEDAVNKSESERIRDEKVFADLEGLSLLNRLKVFTPKDSSLEEIKMNTFSKVSVLEQDDLITSFSTFTQVIHDLSDEYKDIKLLPKKLFAYFVTRDAFQVKNGSISKLFPIEMFKDHSNSIDMAINGTSKIFNKLNDDYTQVYKEFIEKYALSSGNISNFKNLNNGIIKNPPLQNFADLKTNTFDIGKLNTLTVNETLLREALGNYPFKYDIKTSKEGFSRAILTNLPIFVTKSVGTLNQYGDTDYIKVLRRLEYIEIEGEKIQYNDPDFYKIVLEQTDKITKFEYSPFSTINNQYQSIFTIDLKPQVIEEENNNEVPGCNTSF